MTTASVKRRRPTTTDVPTREEQNELMRRYAAAETAEERKAIADIVVERNMPFIHSIAQRYVRPDYPFEDAVQAGYFGMRRAMEKFDPSRGITLVTYASHWVRAKIIRDIQSIARTIRIPHQVWRHYTRARIVEKKDPRAVPTEEQQEAILTFKTITGISLQLPIRIDDSMVFTVEDTIASTTPAPDHDLEPQEGAAFLAQALKVLNPRELDIIGRRFGLTGDEHTLEAIAKRYGLTRERIRQIEANALKKMRVKLHRLRYKH